MLTFADTINFHPRNFPALFRTIEHEGIPVSYVRWGDKAAKLAFGDYRGQQAHLQPHMEELRRVPLPRLFEYHHRGVWLFDVCRYELLHHLMTRRSWYDEHTPNDVEVIFDKAARDAGDELFRNVAAARFWVDFWHETFTSGNRTGQSAIGIFGNSLSYTRALTAQAESHGVVPIVFEHFFTGHDHYMEARKSPIQGFNELRLMPPRSCSPDPQLVFRRLAEAHNKNVQQASFRRVQRPRAGTRRILLLAQVVNDFAALTPGNKRLGTVAVYKDLLELLIEETDLDVVVKAHPYEARKTGGHGPITLDETRAFVASKGPVAQRRVGVVEDYPIESLFCDADLVVTLHSQGALEALAFGLPVATLGNPFYGGKGFTLDFDSPRTLVSALAENPDAFVHGEIERRRYLEYMTHCFRTLVNRNEPSSAVLKRLSTFGIHPGAPEVLMPASDTPAPSPPTTSTEDNGAQSQRAPLQRKVMKLVRDPRGFVADALHNLATRIEGNDGS